MLTIEKCHNDQPGFDCTSKRLAQEPDMRLGDICVLCACWECERCGVLMDLDCEVRIKDHADEVTLRDMAPGQDGGYWTVCEGCVVESDTLYDD